MYSPSTLEFVDSLARTSRTCESERELFERAARLAARARRRERRSSRLSVARLGAQSVLRLALIAALITGAFAAGHAL